MGKSLFTFHVAVVLVDAPHPVQVRHGGLAWQQGLVADQHPLAVELGGLGDLVRPLLVDQRQHLGGPGREDDLEQRRHVLEFLRQVSQMIRHPDRIAVKAPFVQVVADPGQLVCIMPGAAAGAG